MEKGLTYTSQTTVCKGNTALTLGSGDMEVFATPALALIYYNYRTKSRRFLCCGLSIVSKLISVFILR